MDPITIVIGVVGGAAAVAVTRKKSAGTPAAGAALPMASAVPGTIGQDYRFAQSIAPRSGYSYWDRHRLRSRQRYSGVKLVPVDEARRQTRTYQRAQTSPRAQASATATTTTKAVKVYISDRSGGQANVMIFDGRMTPQQISQLQSYINQNRTTSADYRIVTLAIGGFSGTSAGFLTPSQRITPTAAVNLRKLYQGR